ncbi:MAG: hypothetical protein ACFFG0_30245 [Candidatus Thorarchaeota archaeon]
MNEKKKAKLIWEIFKETGFSKEWLLEYLDKFFDDNSNAKLKMELLKIINKLKNE